MEGLLGHIGARRDGRHVERPPVLRIGSEY